MENYYTFNDVERPYARAEASTEATAFIAKLPPDFAAAQRRAILAAQRGDVAELEKIRTSRRASTHDLSGVFVDDEFIERGGSGAAQSAEGGASETGCGGAKLRLRIYTPKTNLSQSRAILLYLHGGGWTINSPENCERFCRDFALKNDAVVVAPDYRLAPEHPFPAANEDAKTAFGWVVRHAKILGGSAGKIFVGGDSAGGHLALSLAVDVRDDDSAKVKPAGVIAFYPALDLRPSERESAKLFGEKFCLNGELMKLYINAYAPTAEAKEAASLFGRDLRGLPRTLLVVSECDILRSEAAEFYALLEAAGVRTRYVCLEGATHIYITQDGMDNAYQTALAEASAFVKAE